MSLSESRCQGVVSDFDVTRGRGVIETETGEQVLVRYAAIQGQGPRELQRGEIVSFYIEQGPNGLSAIQVMRTGAQAVDGARSCAPADTRRLAYTAQLL